jgi:hypothetical protein
MINVENTVWDKEKMRDSVKNNNILFEKNFNI